MACISCNSKKLGKVPLSNITTYLGGPTNTTNRVNVFRWETFLIVENQQCCWSPCVCNVLRIYEKLERWIHCLKVIIIFSILTKRKFNIIQSFSSWCVSHVLRSVHRLVSHVLGAVHWKERLSLHYKSNCVLG